MEKRPNVPISVWRFLRPVLLIITTAVLVTGSTFLVWGDFTWRAYSDRLFWTSIGVILLGGIVTWSALGSYNTLGTPNVLTAPGDARIAHSRVKEHIQMNAKRYTVILRLFAAGAICMAISALVELLTR
jgi:hypothetical protein